MDTIYALTPNVIGSQTEARTHFIQTARTSSRRVAERLLYVNKRPFLTFSQMTIRAFVFLGFRKQDSGSNPGTQDLGIAQVNPCAPAICGRRLRVVYMGTLSRVNSPISVLQAFRGRLYGKNPYPFGDSGHNPLR